MLSRPAGPAPARPGVFAFGAAPLLGLFLLALAGPAWALQEITAVPLAPTLRAATSGANVELSWSGGGDGGRAITKHQFQSRIWGSVWGDWKDIPNSGAGGANASSYTVTGLERGWDYGFKVRAVNDDGAGGASRESVATSPLQLDPPQAPVLQAGDRRIAVSWKPPAVTDLLGAYDLRYRQVVQSGIGPDWSFEPVVDETTSAVLTGLTNGFTYQVQLRASYNDGYGPWSGSSTVTLPTVDAVQLSVSPQTLGENAGQQEVRVTGRLVGGGRRSEPTLVTLSVADGTAVRGSDYTATAPGTLTIPAGDVSGAATFDLTVIDDREREGNETVRVTGVLGSGDSLDVHPATLTIEDNDRSRGGGGGGGGGGSTVASAVELRPRAARVSESAGRMVFKVELSRTSSGPVSVRWWTVDRTATAGRDYRTARGTLTIPAGARSGEIEVVLLDDLLDEPDETFAIRFDQPQGAELTADEAVGTIGDDDAMPSLLIADATAPEGRGRLGFLVFLSSDSGRTVSVDYATRAVSATAGVDYASTSGTLHLPPGSEGETLWTTILDDALDEPSETLEVVLSRPRHAMAGDLLAIGTIEDDDAEPQPTVSDVTVSERAGEMAFVVTLETVSMNRITWDYRTVDGTARGGEDYGTAVGAVVFEPGETRGSVPVAIVDDTVDEVDEDFRLRLVNPREPGFGALEATAVIVDDDDNAIVADAWISRFGRTVATQVVDAVSSRFADGGGGGSHFLLRAGSLQPMLGPGPGRRPFPGAFHGMDPAGGDPWTGSLGVDAARFLSGSSFQVRSPADEPSPLGVEGRWTAWGRSSYLEFDGVDPGVGLTGEVFNVTAGFDVETGRLTTGLALAGSMGTGRYHVARTGVQSERMGEIRSALGSVHPYVHLSLADWLRVWGLGGIGSGSLEISGGGEKADLDLRMLAFGGRGDFRVPAASGLGLALKSDVFWVGTDSGATAVRRASTAEASRMRLLLESTFRLVSVFGGELTPLLEAGFRADAGDAETGRGLEVGSGFRFRNRDRGLLMEVTGRSLVSHQDERYREWGIGGTLRLDPGPDLEGLAIQVASSHGAAASTVQQLWSETGAMEVFPGVAEGRHEAEIGYGFETLRGGALVIPFSGFTLSPSGATRLRVGSRLRLDSRWMLSLQADRTRYGLHGPSYGVILRGHLVPGGP